MKAGNVLAYFALLLAAVVTVWLAAGLFRRYPLKALRYYVMSLVGFFAAGFLKIIGNYTIQELLFNQSLPSAAHTIAAWVFGLLSLPFYVLAVYAFIAMVLSWAEKGFPAAWQAVFFFFQAILLVAYITVGQAVYSGPAHGAAAIFYRVYEAVYVADIAVLAVLLLILAFSWAKKPAVRPLRGIAVFASLYAVLMAAGYIMVFFMGPGILLRVIDPIATFLIHLPPLLVLRRVLDRRYRSSPILPAGGDQVSAVLARYRISEREAEIIRLLVQGKSYRDIEEELFISLKTVKTHVYNIYKKMGIKSRWQLLNLLQAGGAGRPAAAGNS
jgi:DNA-binding CsgD family transcriptional regulator